MEHLRPQEIENESMRIIDSEAGEHGFNDDEWKVVRRIIHATADFEIIETIRFYQKALDAGIHALKAGAPVYTDTQMLAAAISSTLREKCGSEILCFISDDDVKMESAKTGKTRSSIAVRKAAPLLNNAIIAIGNAPTALYEALSLYEQGNISPALIIGMPVGFVEAQESKEMLYKSSCPYITNLSRKGGTPATAAAVNALIRIAEGN